MQHCDVITQSSCICSKKDLYLIYFEDSFYSLIEEHVMDYNIVCDLNKLTKTGKYMASLQTCHAVVESAQAKTAVVARV